MARPGITFEQVAAAAAVLTSEGSKPTIQAVRAQLGGTGSPNTILTHLKAWTAGQASSAPAAPAQTLPASITAAINDLLARAETKGREDVQAELKTEQETTRALSEHCEKLEAERDELTNDLEATRASWQRMVTQETMNEQINDDLKAELERAQAATTRASVDTAKNLLAIETLEKKNAELVEEIATAVAHQKWADAARIKAEKDAAVSEARKEGETRRAEKAEAETQEARQAAKEYAKVYEELTKLAAQAKPKAVARPAKPAKKSVASASKDTTGDLLEK